MDTKDKTYIIVANTDIQHVMNGGGIVWSGVEAPGPKTLIGGNLQAGFYGECPTSELITGDELASMIGLTAGVSQNSKMSWLKFSYMGKVEFVAKRPFRHTLSWDNINAVNAVFGDRMIKIKDNTYKIRLMKGKTEGKQDDYSAYRGDICKGSEWNKLMLPISDRAPSNWAMKDNVNSPTENWNTRYSEWALNGGKSVGYYSWCQERGNKYPKRLIRGSAVSQSSCYDSPSIGSSLGWRPVLELVE